MPGTLLGAGIKKQLLDPVLKGLTGAPPASKP